MFTAAKYLKQCIQVSIEMQRKDPTEALVHLWLVRRGVWAWRKSKSSVPVYKTLQTKAFHTWSTDTYAVFHSENGCSVSYQWLWAERQVMSLLSFRKGCHLIWHLGCYLKGLVVLSLHLSPLTTALKHTANSSGVLRYSVTYSTVSIKEQFSPTDLQTQHHPLTRSHQSQVVISVLVDWLLGYHGLRRHVPLKAGSVPWCFFLYPSVLDTGLGG